MASNSDMDFRSLGLCVRRQFFTEHCSNIVVPILRFQFVTPQSDVYRRMFLNIGLEIVELKLTPPDMFIMILQRQKHVTILIVVYKLIKNM